MNDINVLFFSVDLFTNTLFTNVSEKSSFLLELSRSICAFNNFCTLQHDVNYVIYESFLNTVDDSVSLSSTLTNSAGVVTRLDGNSLSRVIYS